MDKMHQRQKKLSRIKDNVEKILVDKANRFSKIDSEKAVKTRKVKELDKQNKIIREMSISKVEVHRRKMKEGKVKDKKTEEKEMYKRFRKDLKKTE